MNEFNAILNRIPWAQWNWMEHQWSQCYIESLYWIQWWNINDFNVM